MYILTFYKIDQAKTLDLFLHQETKSLCTWSELYSDVNIYVIHTERSLSDKFRGDVTIKTELSKRYSSFIFNWLGSLFQQALKEKTEKLGLPLPQLNQ